MPEPGASDPSVVLSFRHRASVRRMLESIQDAKGHEDLSDTLRDAVDEYIRAWLGLGKAPAADGGRLRRIG